MRLKTSLLAIAFIALASGAQAQDPLDLLGTWGSTGSGSSESIQIRPDGTYEQAAIYADIYINEIGRFQSKGNSLTLYPVRRIYRRGSVTQPDATSVRTYSWHMVFDSVAQRRVLVLEIGGTTIELREDAASASAASRDAARRLPDLRGATVCETPKMRCAIEVRGVHRVGDLCSCSNAMGMALDYGRAR